MPKGWVQANTSYGTGTEESGLRRLFYKNDRKQDCQPARRRGSRKPRRIATREKEIVGASSGLRLRSLLSANFTTSHHRDFYKATMYPLNCLTKGFRSVGVQLWVQLARSLAANFGVKRCRINGWCEI